MIIEASGDYGSLSAHGVLGLFFVGKIATIATHLTAV
jgi:hypothetical protein